MKRLLLSICMMFLLMNVTGCSLFSNGDNANNGTTNNGGTTNPTKPNQMDDGGTTNNDALNENKDNLSVYKNVADVMNAMQMGGLTYMNEKELSDFHFPAHEGKEFMMDNQTFYLYRMDSTTKDVQTMLNDIEKNGYVKIIQDGKEGQKSAYRMGDFVLIYPEGYDIQKVKDILNKKV